MPARPDLHRERRGGFVCQYARPADPSLRTKSSHGATSSPTTPPPTLTASGTNSPASANFTLSATSVPARSCASAVDAPRCGVTTTCGRSNSGLSVFGSVAKTSMPAARTCPLDDRLGQRLLVDQPAAGGVDDDHARLGLGQRLLADQPGGLRRLRQVHGDEVGPRQQLVERQQLDAELRGAGGRHVWVVGHHVRAERGQPRATSWPMRPRPTTPTVLP